MRIERETLEHQTRIYKDAILTALTHTHISVSANRIHPVAGLYTFMNNGGSHIYRHEQAISNLILLKDFITLNAPYLTISSTDEDSPINLFQLKLPVKYPESNEIQWSNFQEVFEYITDTPLSVDPIHERTIHSIFQKAERNGAMNMLQIYDIVKKTLPVYTNPTYLIPYINILRKRTSFGKIGKQRWTAGMLVFWGDCICHTALTTAVLPHVQKCVRTILTGIPEHRTLILTEADRIDDVDPITLEPFQEGDEVVNVVCCGKYLLKASMDGIYQSGRTPKCPLCRTQLPPMYNQIQESESGLLRLLSLIPPVTPEHIGTLM